MLGTICRIAVLALLHSILLLAVNHFSILLWEHPRGVTYGITLYYSCVFLSLLGVVLLVIFSILRPLLAVVTSLVAIFSVGFAMFPGSFAPSYVSPFAGSGIFFVSLWIAKEHLFEWRVGA